MALQWEIPEKVNTRNGNLKKSGIEEASIGKEMEGSDIYGK
jgi:hypothetical protein